MARILVTGGCGFIGANLVPNLEQAGHEVVVLDNLCNGKAEYLSTTAAEVIQGDIRDGAAVEQALDGVDKVIHLAAFGGVVDSVKDPRDNFDVNALGTFSVLNACRRTDVKQVTFASTGGALIGNANPPVNEESLPKPISPYGSSKLCGEAYCCSFAHSYGMNITALRFANVYGPFSGHKKGAVTAFMRAVYDGTPIRIFGDGKATRDFLHSSELCQGITLAQTSNLVGFNVFHLATGREVSVLELAKAVCKAADAPDHPIEFRDKRAGEVERNFARYDRAREVLGFRPSMTLENGLHDTWMWLREHEFQA